MKLRLKHPKREVVADDGKSDADKAKVEEVEMTEKLMLIKLKMENLMLIKLRMESLMLI